MSRRLLTYRGGAVGLLAVTLLLIASQPLGVFWHVIHDHHDAHTHHAPDSGVVHLGDVDAPEHDADHGHAWMIPAAVVVGPQLGQPQATASIKLAGHVPLLSLPLAPPFSPPRA